MELFGLAYSIFFLQKIAKVLLNCFLDVRLEPILRNISPSLSFLKLGKNRLNIFVGPDNVRGSCALGFSGRHRIRSWRKYFGCRLNNCLFPSLFRRHNNYSRIRIVRKPANIYILYLGIALFLLAYRECSLNEPNALELNSKVSNYKVFCILNT
jgi:hypothetical protein